MRVQIKITPPHNLVLDSDEDLSGSSFNMKNTCVLHHMSKFSQYITPHYVDIELNSLQEAPEIFLLL